MRRRHSLKSKSDLIRRKSTSSVHSVHLEHINPALAERDAHIAAFEAFTRAQGRATANMPLFPPTPDSSPRHRQTDRDIPRHDANGDGLRRRQSVRFVGPFSVQGRTGPTADASTKRNSTDIHGTPSKPEDGDDTGSSHSSVLGLEEVSAPALPPRRPPPRPQRAPPSIALPGISTRYIDALAAEDEYYHPEDDIASMPSSYRRLRRSRSLLTAEEQRKRGGQDSPARLRHIKTPVRGPSPSSTNPRALHPLSKEVASPRATPPLRAPKSMSFLRNRRILPGSRTSRESNRHQLDLDGPNPDEHGEQTTLMAARSTPQLGGKASSIFGSRTRRADPPMRKSLRSGNTTDHSENNDPDTLLGRDDGFKNRARKASRTLKTKLKSLFSMSRSEDSPPTIPAQHIESQRTHVSEDLRSMLESEIGQLHGTDWGSFHQVPSRVPALQTVPANIIRSNRGSLESLKSERERKVSDDRSLTSWTHSGPSTLTSQQQQQWREWEAQRLSVIRENGTHAPSPSMRRPVLGTQLFQNHSHSLVDPIVPHHSTDSQRIYSALMKRIQVIQEKNEDIVEQRKRNFDFKDSDTDCGTPYGLSGVGVSCDTPKAVEYRTAQPIRPPRDPSATPTRSSGNASYGGEQQDGLGRRPQDCSISQDHQACSTEFCKGSTQSSTDPGNAGGFEVESSLISVPRTASPDPFTSRPGERTAPAQELKAFSGRGSAFFGSPSSHLFRTKSPYRRALRQSIHEDNAKRHEGLGLQQQSEVVAQLRVAMNCDNFSDDYRNDGSYSESMYSTDDRDVAEVAIGPGQHFPIEDSRGNGDSPPTYHPAGCHVDSSSSSLDWKTWLSANMAKLESSPPYPAKPSDIKFALPTMPKGFSGGHVREKAQTYEDYEGEVKTPEPTTRKPTLPTSPLAIVEPNVVKPPSQQRPLKRATPPANRTLPENDDPSGVPPIPPKSALRAGPSPLRRAGPNICYSAAHSTSSSPGLSAAVQKQFGLPSRRGGLFKGFNENEVSEESSDEGQYVNHDYQQRKASMDPTDAFI
ncbi:hypothetical protein QBC34DRAFT_206727 [Podospora aff. communis PSN243]|uniref:Uncharacterized protein n=1 Tax=Podospora aff. communis PSN243 TaxID=3040156 RepID=A0AAV9H1C3_9PEZI|nr:hypothetical protein QBC34DRAFT_206727 [Podospora aff. communis PSN243]